MTETSLGTLGWHQVGCSRCVDQRWRTTCHPMKSVYAVRGASRCQLNELISFLDVGRRLDDRTLPGIYTPERDHSINALVLVARPSSQGTVATQLRWGAIFNNWPLYGQISWRMRQFFCIYHTQVFTLPFPRNSNHYPTTGFYHPSTFYTPYRRPPIVWFRPMCIVLIIITMTLIFFSVYCVLTLCILLLCRLCSIFCSCTDCFSFSLFAGIAFYVCLLIPVTECHCHTEITGYLTWLDLSERIGQVAMVKHRIAGTT